MDELDDALGAAPPAELAALPADDRATLAALIRKASAARTAALDESITQSLRRMPAVMRGPVRKALGL